MIIADSFLTFTKPGVSSLGEISPHKAGQWLPMDGQSTTSPLCDVAQLPYTPRHDTGNGAVYRRGQLVSG